MGGVWFVATAAYAGSMSSLVLVANAGEGTITTLRLMGERLWPAATSPVGRGVSTFAVDGDRDLVHAGVKADGDLAPAIVTLRLDRESGVLRELSRREVDAPLAYLTLSDDRRFLLGASYHGGFAGSWPVAPEGAVGARVGLVERPNMHCVVADGSFVYAVSLGADLVVQARIVDDGDLQSLGDVPLPAGCGPRHLVLDGGNAYLVTEYSGEVFHLTRGDDGLLTLRESVSVVDPSAGLKRSRMGADPRAEHLIWAADVHLASPIDAASPRSASGRGESRSFLLASERTASTLASVPIAADGTLGEPVALEHTVEQPRGFTVHGDLVLVTGERASELDVLRLGGDGAPEPVQRIGVGNGANWVRVVAAR